MAELLDRVLNFTLRVRDIVIHLVAWAVWIVKVIGAFVAHYAPVVVPVVRQFGRTAALLLAGLVIPFIRNHGNFVGLQWMVFVSVVSLVMADDRATVVAKAVWWMNVVFTGAALLGLLLGTISAVSALSLAIPLALFESVRGFIRREAVTGWGSAVLAIVLMVIVFPSDHDSVIATGTIGAWAIVLGVFAAIGQSETLMSKGKRAFRRVTKR